MSETTAPTGTHTPPHVAPPGDAVSKWLASAHPSPNTVRREWSSIAKLGLIPLGSRFDAVRLPDSIVQAAVGSNDPVIVFERLIDHLAGGPVIHDPRGRRYYALVPPATAADWVSPVAECLGSDSYLGVPPTQFITLDEDTLSSYWAVPMTWPGILCRPADVLAFATAGHAQTTEGAHLAATAGGGCATTRGACRGM